MPTRFPQHSGGVPTPEQAFQYAAKTGNLDQVQVLLPSVDVNSQGVDGGTALHRAASYGRTGIVELLLAHGADPNARDKSQNTPLHSAVATSQIDAAAVLLQRGADPNAQDNYGNSPLIAALGSSEMVELTGLLLEHGANPLQENKAGMSAYKVTQIRDDSEAHNLMAAYLGTAPQ